MLIEYKGHHINPESIKHISKVHALSNGSLHCDWDYGFEINIDGEVIKIYCETKTDSAGNHYLSHEERIAFAKKQKNKLLKLITQQKQTT